MCIKNIIVIIIFFQLIACRNGNRNDTTWQERVSDNKANSLIKKANKYDTVRSSQENPIFKKDAFIQILSLAKEFDPNSSTYDSTASTMKEYNNWILNKKDILNILRSGKPISGTDWDLSYIVLPFWYKGEFLVNGDKGNYKINAASFVILKFKDTTIYLGCPQKNMQQFFLVPPNSD